MPLATLADLEAIRGPRYVRELLSSAVDKAAAPATQDAQRQARLDAALRAGDNLIRQFLDLDAILDDATATASVRQLAIDEAIYYLQCESPTGASQDAVERAQMRRTDLAQMRKRDQFPAKPIGQSTVRSGVVVNCDQFGRAGMKGYY